MSDLPRVLKEVKSPSALCFPCAWWEMVFGVVFPSAYKCRVVGLGVPDCFVCRCVQFVACQTHAMLSQAFSSYLFSDARKGRMKIRTWLGCEDAGSLCSFKSPMNLLKCNIHVIWVSGKVFCYCRGHLMSYLVSPLIKLCSWVGVIGCSLVMVPLGGRWWNILYVLLFLSFSVSSNALWGTSALLDG